MAYLPFRPLCLLGTVLVATNLLPGEELRISAYDGYVPQAIADGFAAQVKATTGKTVSVKVTVIGNNDDAFGAIRTGKADVVSATANLFKAEKYKVLSGKLVRPIATAAMKNYPDLLPDLRNHPYVVDGGQQYGVPMNYGPMGLAYNTKLVPQAPTSWKALVAGDRPFAVGKDWPDAHVAIAALVAGVAKEDVFTYDQVNTPAVKANLAIMGKKAARKWAGVDDAASLKGLALATAWGFAFTDLAKDGEAWAFASPQEGTLGYLDAWAIPAATAPDVVPLAEAFIDYSISPAAQAILVRSIGAMATNGKTAAELKPEEVTAAKLDDPTYFRTQLIMLKPLTVRDANGLAKLWDEAQR